MASNDIKKFYFYQDYLWAPGDFALLQQWLLGETQGLLEGLSGAAVLSGLKTFPGSGMSANVQTGIAVSDGGQMMVLSSGVPVSVPAPIGNPAKHLLVMRPKLVNENFIPEPLNPSNPVPLYQKLDFDLMLLQGAPAVNPSYPATQAGDVIVMGFKDLQPGQTQLVQANLDFGVVSRPRKRKLHVAVKVGGTYNVGDQDDVVELDCGSASGMALLPPAASCEGMKISVVRIDAATGNDCAVSGNEPISGQPAIFLEDQWQTATVYCNGISWRQI